MVCSYKSKLAIATVTISYMGFERTVLNAGLQSAKSRPHRKLKMEMSLYSRSTYVIHHVSHWLICHDSVSVRQSSGNRSGSGINCMHANDICGESGVFVIWYHHTMS